MIIPPKLTPHDKVALLAPARWPNDSYIQGLSAALNKYGFEPMPHPQLQARMELGNGRVGQLAGEDEVRAAALNEALNDATIKAIFFPRGGTGTYRILDRIDYDAAARNPKIIMGYSDLDCLLAALNQRSGLVTFRGPMGVNFADPARDPRTERECFELLTGLRSEWTWEGATCLRPGVAEGGLVGGNLAVLNAQIGTPFEVDTEGKIVVVEDCDELTYRIDRFLYQAAAAGKFAKAKAVLFGTLENMVDGEQHDGSGLPFGIALRDMLLRYVPDHVPLASGLPLGHGTYLSSHPIGASVRVEIGESVTRMQLLAPVVR
ncbi:MAG: LD-carboxypeptidase [Bdellovibrionales bacterium]